MPSLLSNQERRILAAAHRAGVIRPGEGIAFDWRQAAQEAGMPADEAATALKALRRFGFVGAIGSRHAQLTESGARAAESLPKPG